VRLKNGETEMHATAPIVIGAPTYFAKQNLIQETGKVVRCICLLDHPIPNIAEKAKSCQIIIPQNELKRRNDIYIICVSYAHKVCPEPFYIAMVSTTVETKEPEKELLAGLALLGPIKEKFFSVTPLLAPLNDGSANKCFISKSMDATTHFESACDDITSLYRRITGKDYDYEKDIKEPTEEQ